MHLPQHRRNVAVHNPQRESFHNRRLANTGFARQNWIVLPAPGEDIHHLPDLEIASKHRIDLSVLCVLGEVNGVLIQIRRLAASRARERRRISGVVGVGSLLLFPRPGNDAEKILSQRFRRYSLQLLAHVAHDAREFIVCQNRQDQMAGTNMRRVEIDGAHRPGFGHHFQYGRADGGRAGIPGFQFVQTSREFLRKLRGIDAELVEDPRCIAILHVQQFHQDVLNLDIVVCARQAEPRRAFERAARRVVQFPDQ